MNILFLSIRQGPSGFARQAKDFYSNIENLVLWGEIKAWSSGPGFFTEL